MEVPKMLQSLQLHTATPFPPWAVGLSLGVWPLVASDHLRIAQPPTGADDPLTAYVHTGAGWSDRLGREHPFREEP